MRTCSQFSLAVVALSFLAMTGCAHTGASQSPALSGANTPLMTIMGAAGKGETAKAGYAKHPQSPIAEAMSAEAAGAYTKVAR